MKMFPRVLVASTVVAGVLVVQGQSADPAFADLQDPGGQPGLGWQYSAAANGYYRAPEDEGSPGGGGNTGPATVFTDWGDTPGGDLICPENDPAFDCGGGTSGMYCGWAEGDNGLPRYPWIRYEREIQPNGEPGPWRGVDAACDEVGGDDFVSMIEIRDHINYAVFEPLEDPQIALEPNARTFVNWPTIVSTTYPEGVEDASDIDVTSMEPTVVEIPLHIPAPVDLHGTITANATYQWAFQEGGTATGRGRPYVEGQYPEDNPGYYITSTFNSTGQKTVELTVTFTGTVVVETLDPEEIEPVVITNTETIQVGEARSVLVR